MRHDRFTKLDFIGFAWSKSAKLREAKQPDADEERVADVEHDTVK